MEGLIRPSSIRHPCDTVHIRVTLRIRTYSKRKSLEERQMINPTVVQTKVISRPLFLDRESFISVISLSHPTTRQPPIELQTPIFKFLDSLLNTQKVLGITRESMSVLCLSTEIGLKHKTGRSYSLRQRLHTWLLGSLHSTYYSPHFFTPLINCQFFIISLRNLQIYTSFGLNNIKYL